MFKQKLHTIIILSVISLLAFSTQTSYATCDDVRASHMSLSSISNSITVEWNTIVDCVFVTDLTLINAENKLSVKVIDVDSGYTFSDLQYSQYIIQLDAYEEIAADSSLVQMGTIEKWISVNIENLGKLFF